MIRFYLKKIDFKSSEYVIKITSNVCTLYITTRILNIAILNIMNNLM